MPPGQTTACRAWQWRCAVVVALLCAVAGVQAADAAPAKGSYDGAVAATPAEKSWSHVALQDPKVNGKRAPAIVEAWCLCALTIEEAVFLRQYDFEMNAR
jgi:hypothetical protein